MAKWRLQLEIQKAPYDKEEEGKQMRADKKCKVLKPKKLVMHDKNTRENKDF